MTDEHKEKNILEVGRLHRLMVLFQQPESWPVWFIISAGAVIAALVGAAWRVLKKARPVAWVAALLHFAFLMGDLVLLWQLPRRGRSFGPWKAQGTVLAVPRTLGSMAMGLLATAVGPVSALLALVVGQLAGTALLVWGAVLEPFRLALTRLNLTVVGLPPEAAPLRLLHISDLHVERLTQREERLLQLVHEAEPDLILITGDYVNLSYNTDPETHRQVQHLLGQLEAPYGVFATLGSPPVDVRSHVPDLFDDLPVQLLRDEWVTVDAGQGRCVALLGMDCTHHLDEDAARLERLVAKAPPVQPRVLLYHSPELMPEASAYEFDLYLCGHTHGGQVRLPGYGAIITSSQLGRRYVMGHYQEGRSHLYVSRGVGLEGLSAPRVRFLSPPEITLIRLEGKASPAT